jgi:uncharacterized membrane protein
VNRFLLARNDPRRRLRPACHSPVACLHSPVIPFSWPNAACASVEEALFSPGGRENGRGEVTMAKRRTSSKSFHAVAGALLLSIGLLLLFANLDELAERVGNSFSFTPGALGAVVEIGLAGMRAVEAYFFDQAAFQAGLHWILVSLWPLIVVMIGATLLRKAIGKRQVHPRLGRIFPAREYESES